MTRHVAGLTSYVVAALLAAPFLALSGPTAAVEPPTCGGRPATLIGTPGDDTLVGTDGDDVIVAFDGDDFVQALDGDDVVCGGPGKDLLEGNDGDDRLLGGLGESRLRGGPGDDTLIGAMVVGSRDQAASAGRGQDVYFMRFVMQGAATLGRPVGRVDLQHRVAQALTVGQVTTYLPVRGVEDIRVTRGRWTLRGTPADESFAGGVTQDAWVVIHAGGGDDLLVGSRRDDLLDGGPGDDTVRVTSGDDTCVSVERFLGGPAC